MCILPYCVYAGYPAIQIETLLTTTTMIIVGALDRHYPVPSTLCGRAECVNAAAVPPVLPSCGVVLCASIDSSNTVAADPHAA